MLRDLACPLCLQLPDLKAAEGQSVVESLLETEPIDKSDLKTDAQKQFQFLDGISMD